MDIDRVFSNIEPNALPRLKNVAISSTTNPSQFDKFVQYANGLARNLRTLDIRISTPSQYVLPTSLGRLELTIFEQSRSSIGSTRDLASLLLSAPLLEDITLDIRTPEQFNSYDGNQIVAVPNVKTLSLRMTALCGLTPLLDSLYFPDLFKLSMELTEKYRDRSYKRGGRFASEDSDDDSYEMGDDVNSGLDLVDKLLLHDKKVYPKLTILSLKLHFPSEDIHCGVQDMETIFTDVAENCPALDHLTLESTILIKYMKLPPLRTLTLLRCNLQNTKFLSDHEHDIEDRIEVNGCGLLEGVWEDLHFEEEPELVFIDPMRGRIPAPRW